MPDTLHFVRPEWLLAVPLALLLAWLWARRARRASRWTDAIDPDLLGALLEAPRRGGARRLPTLFGAALATAAIGLAGPAWERLPQPVEQGSDAVIIVLDLSLSMFAEDVPPARLIRARQKVADILRQRREGLTALIAYAGNAHTVVPLTDDVRTIENLLPALSPDMMPVYGSNVGEAIDLAHDLFRSAGIGQGLILVITDGIDRIAEATERRNRNFPISILGVGTDAGGTIPLAFANQPGEVLRTRQGEAILARLDIQRLTRISQASYGRYRTLGLGDEDIEYLLATPLPGPDATREIDRNFDLWADRGYWAAILLLPVLLLAFRRGVLLLVPLLLLPLPADAGIWDDLWQRRDQQAHRQLQEGQPELAATLFRDPDWRAIALYRSGEYAHAGELFAADGSLTGRYNQGNALARLGDYRGAIERYDTVLAEQPDHDDARFNRELMEKLLAEQQAAEQNNDEQQSPSEGDPDATSQPEQSPDALPPEDDGNDDTAEDGDAQPPDQDQATRPETGEPEEAELQESDRDMDADAMEQWLRRVPDDPGGLLRRKFQYETNQRLRRGEYRAADPEQIW